VAAGVTVVVPEGPKVPMPEIVTETAFVVVQDKTEGVPGLITEGCAVSVSVVFGVAGSKEEVPPPPQASWAAKANSSARFIGMCLRHKRYLPYILAVNLPTVAGNWFERKYDTGVVWSQRYCADEFLISHCCGVHQCPLALINH
jgi:hypothetical protein